MRPRSMAGALALVLSTAVACTTSVASAASLGGAGAEQVAAGSAALQVCDTDGFTISYVTSGGKVTTVTLSDIAPACDGGTVRLTLATSGGTSLGEGGPTALPVVGGATPRSLDLTISPQATASSVQYVHVGITGP